MAIPFFPTDIVDPESVTVPPLTQTPIPPSEADTSIVPVDKSNFEFINAAPELLFKYTPTAFVPAPDFINPLFLISSSPFPNACAVPCFQPSANIPTPFLPILISVPAVVSTLVPLAAYIPTDPSPDIFIFPVPLLYISPLLAYIPTEDAPPSDITPLLFVIVTTEDGSDTPIISSPFS